ncbi:Protein smg8 [Cichlidogyrus casuarinus]|uniref:Nonsense-mediated mRNA decay factor SMG8 n=1 Tax=Cichlidogyrus casuarinus TaxID=1844966 RepID=A0ABD2Q1F1_9PLAT
MREEVCSFTYIVTFMSVDSSVDFRSENDLFTLHGFKFVYIDVPSCTKSTDERLKLQDGDNCQLLFEALISNVSLSTLDTFFDRSFERFLDARFQEFYNEHLSNSESPSISIPNIKVWFIAVSKLYASLWGSNKMQPASEADDGAIMLNEQIDRMLCPVERDLLSEKAPCNMQERTKCHSLLHSLDSLMSCLCEYRLKSALTAAESHYKEGLPLHYSKTYHLMKIVSSFTVLMNLARGPKMYQAMSTLTQRLTRLFLAGRVICSSKSILGHPCSLELHRVPHSVQNLELELKAINEGLAVDAYGFRCRPVEVPSGSFSSS